MKNHLCFQLIRFIVLLSFILAMPSCKKSDESTATLSATSGSATQLGQGWATLNGTVTPNNQVTLISFEYGTDTSYGHSIAANPDTLTGNVVTIVTANLMGLTANSTYYFRTKATNSTGTKYGSDASFTTTKIIKGVYVFNTDLTYGSVTDVEGNIYKTILIGTQTWMAENLKTTKFNDGTIIPFIIDGTKWAGLSSPGYCWYNSDSVSYGGMYNWYAVNSGNLCPTGWHVPTDAQWTALSTYLGGENVTGGKLKETGTTHWYSSITASNSSGFTALPGGYRTSGGDFSSIKRIGYYWTSTEASSTEVYFRDMSYNYTAMDKSSSSKLSGFSVRCIQD
jgi:uncharacterized protein (TIGR02145 family)